MIIASRYHQFGFPSSYRNNYTWYCSPPSGPHQAGDLGARYWTHCEENTPPGPGRSNAYCNSIQCILYTVHPTVYTTVAWLTVCSKGPYCWVCQKMWPLRSRLCLFDTQTFDTLIQSTMTLYTIYEATAIKIEFSNGKSCLATLF